VEFYRWRKDLQQTLPEPNLHPNCDAAAKLPLTAPHKIRARPATRMTKQNEGFYERSQPHYAQDPIAFENHVALVPIFRLQTGNSILMIK
jgi:hypothetical protein